jgi:hypothetical protein
MIRQQAGRAKAGSDGGASIQRKKLTPTSNNTKTHKRNKEAKKKSFPGLEHAKPFFRAF